MTSLSPGVFSRLLLALFLSMQVVPARAAPLALDPYSCCDGQVLAGTALGEPVWQNAPGSVFFYYRVPPEFTFTVGSPVYLAVTYLDEAEGTVVVEYDSNLGEEIPAYYRRTETHTRSSRVGTGTFATSYHELRSPRLGGRQNGGSDFRVVVAASSTGLRIKSVKIQAEPFDDAQFLMVLSRPWLAPYAGPTRDDVARDTLKNKVMTGYQGWFRAPNDLADQGWSHWCRDGRMVPENISVDQWPDLREYCANELFRAGEILTRSGQPAFLFSSTTPETVRRHFQWMRKHQIDGAFLQRFVNESSSGAFGHPEWVLNNVRAAAHQEGRIWAIEYDVSTLREDHAYRVLTTDWKWLVDVVRIREDSRYAREGTKPVVFVWGLPFPHIGLTPGTADAIVDFLKNDPVYGGNYVIGGIPWWWQRSDLSAWLGHVALYDGVLTWMPEEGGYEQDLAALSALGIDYFPHVWPGFAWAHLQRQAPGTDFFVPRNGGEFFWNRIHGAIGSGASRLFVGMFDEYDESTAVMPMSDDPPNPAPDWGRFITNDGRPSDWWLSLSRAAREVLTGQRVLEPWQPEETELANRSNLGDEAMIDLGGTDLASGLSRRTPDDGDTAVVIAGGRECRTNVDPETDHYVYFTLDETFGDSVVGGLDATIEIEYFDAPAGTELTLEYDGLSSPYSLHEKRVITQGEAQWRTARFEVADGFFGNRQNESADFRIRFIQPEAVFIDRVWVRLPEGMHPADTTAPQLDLVGSAEMTVECHGSFVDPGAEAFDGCAGDLSSAIVVSGAVDVNTPGTYTLTYQIEDQQGNLATALRQVTVQDSTPPELNCPENLVAPCAAELHLTVNYPIPEVSDECDTAPRVEFTPPSGSAFAIGTHQVLCRATDAAGNETTCAFWLTRPALGFTGFLPPIGGADGSGGTFERPLKTFKLGSTVPVKFKADCGGAPVSSGVHTLQAVRASSATNGEVPIDATPTGSATSGNRFVLSENGEWHFNLDTRATGMTPGVWRLFATLADGSQHAAWIQLK